MQALHASNIALSPYCSFYCWFPKQNSQAIDWTFSWRQLNRLCSLRLHHHHHHHHRRRHLSLNRKGRWGTIDDFTTSFLHFSLFSTALLDLANSRPVHSLLLSSHLFFCLLCLLPPPPPPSLCLARWFWPDLMNRRHVHTTAVCVSLQWSGGLHVVLLPAGFWQGLPRLLTWSLHEMCSILR